MSDEQLNALVAEKVMGWIRAEDDIVGLRWRSEHDTITAGRWHPYTDIAQAWQVVERMHERGYNFFAGDRIGKKPWAAFFLDGDNLATADSMEAAICTAALRAVGVEVDNDRV